MSQLEWQVIHMHRKKKLRYQRNLRRLQNSKFNLSLLAKKCKDVIPEIIKISDNTTLLQFRLTSSWIQKVCDVQIQIRYGKGDFVPRIRNMRFVPIHLNEIAEELKYILHDRERDLYSKPTPNEMKEVFKNHQQNFSSFVYQYDKDMRVKMLVAGYFGYLFQVFRIFEEKKLCDCRKSRYSYKELYQLYGYLGALRHEEGCAVNPPNDEIEDTRITLIQNPKLLLATGELKFDCL